MLWPWMAFLGFTPYCMKCWCWKDRLQLSFMNRGNVLNFKESWLSPGRWLLPSWEPLVKRPHRRYPQDWKERAQSNVAPCYWPIPQNRTSGRGGGPLAVNPSNKHCWCMPFGHGVCVCTGAQLAKVEVMTGLFCILQKQKFEISPIWKHLPICLDSQFNEMFDCEIQLIET